MSRGKGQGHNFRIETRQKNDELYRWSDPILNGETLESPVRLVDGYGAVKFLIFGDRAFRLRVEEAPTPDGPWVETNRFNSETNDDGVEVIAVAILPAAPYMRVFVDNDSGSDMATFQFTWTGQPIASGTISGGGGGGGGDACCPPGDTLTSAADLTLGIGVTAALTPPPAGTRSMTVNVTGGDSSTLVRVREVGGVGGRQLVLRGSTMYGGADGAIAPLEVEHEAGAAATVHIDFERN